MSKNIFPPTLSGVVMPWPSEREFSVFKSMTMFLHAIPYSRHELDAGPEIILVSDKPL